MKKITLSLSLAMMITGAVTGQTFVSPVAPDATERAVTSQVKPVFRKGHEKTNTSESFWLNYAYTKDSINGGVANTWWNYLFPDSTVIACSDPLNPSSCYDPWVHILGNVLDVRSTEFQFTDGINWNANNSYTVDSMDMVYLYQRQDPNTSVVDTLLVYLFTNATSTDLPTYWFTGAWPSSNWGIDTLRYKQIKYSYASNMPNVSAGMVTIKVPLTASDTAWFYYGLKSFKTNNFPVPAGKLVACGIAFKPGYSYTNGDTITKNKNNFMFVSYEENGTNTLPSYLPNDWNVSEIARSTERYNINPWSGGGLLLPSYAFLSGYGTEHHLISWKVTSNNVGVSEATPVNGIKLYQNTPNPALNTTKISYEIQKNGNVSIVISDVTGRMVARIDEGEKSAGKHSIYLETKSLNQGIYFYTLNVDGFSTTRRLAVTE